MGVEPDAVRRTPHRQAGRLPRLRVEERHRMGEAPRHPDGAVRGEIHVVGAARKLDLALDRERLRIELGDRAVDAVGYQAVDKSGSKEQPNIVLDQLIMVTRPTGGLGIPGLYVPSDPGAPDEQSGKGQILISLGKLFEKGLTLGTGQCNVKAYNRYLRDLIISGRAKPSFVVSHEVGLEDAPMAYDKFDKRIEGYTKVLVHPNGPL